jgi:hypothetical protein
VGGGGFKAVQLVDLSIMFVKFSSKPETGVKAVQLVGLTIMCVKHEVPCHSYLSQFSTCTLP